MSISDAERRRLKKAIWAPLALVAFSSQPASAQLLTLGDVILNVNLLNTQVTNNTTDIANLTVDVSALNSQVSTNTASIAQLTVDLSVLDGQVSANSAAILTLDGRVTAVETFQAGLDGRLSTAEAGLVSIDAAVSVNTAAIAANDLRDDQQDVAIAANDLRDDQQDVSITANTTALAANNLRDDQQDASIATLDGRVTGHDQVLAQHATAIDFATNTALDAQTAATTLRADVDAGRIGLVQQQGPSAPVTVAAQTGGSVVTFSGTDGDRRLSGVAPGVAANDAVNLAQMQAGDVSTLSAAQNYTDTSLTAFAAQLDRSTVTLMQANNRSLRRDINAAAAATAAISSLPQSIIPGDGMAAMSIGGRGSDVAFALGLSKAFKANYTPVVRAGAAWDARRGTLTYNAAVGLHF